VLTGLGSEGDDSRRESLMHVEVDRISDPAQIEALASGIAGVLADVRAAVDDWKPMIARLAVASEELERRATGIDAADIAEARAFLQWLAADHFTLLGYRGHDLVVANGEDALAIVAQSGLGILRDKASLCPASYSSAFFT
jgi:glutamate dehydrogenase